MNRAAFLMLLFAMCPLIAADKDWVPSKVVAIKGKQVEDLTIKERTYEIFEHDVKPEWGYKAPQQDNFVVIHPKKIVRMHLSMSSCILQGTMLFLV
jgi:hypothetical protein